MRGVPLTAIQGIDRLRPRGGARADHLYDFVNGYRTAAKTAKVRPGTVRVATLPAGTHGLTAFAGKLHVFISSGFSGDVPEGFVAHTLLHPEDPDAQLEKIHFAEPFMGAMYVVAEVADGAVHHYWVQAAQPWEANKEYSANELVEPTTPNGRVYRATRLGNASPSWSPGVPRKKADRIEPTTYKEYYYEAIDVTGDNPRAGSIEPQWPTNTGQTLIENADDAMALPASVTPPTPPAPNQPQPQVASKYTLR